MNKKELLSENKLARMAQPVESAICPCVYFLFRDRKVVYVGKSEAGGIPRITSHCKDKMFDSFTVMRCDPGHLSRTEANYIGQFQPEYNKALLKTDHGTTPRLNKSINNKIVTPKARQPEASLSFATVFAVMENYCGGSQGAADKLEVPISDWMQWGQDGEAPRHI
jgi:hypothetical protein